MTVEAAWLDPITLEILWSRLISMLDEADTTLLRTSYSPIVGEAHDYACCLMDSEGNLLAEASTTLPAFVGILSKTAKTFLQQFPPETLQPGDVLVSNDPWIAPDISRMSASSRRCSIRDGWWPWPVTRHISRTLVEGALRRARTSSKKASGSLRSSSTRAVKRTRISSM